MAVVWGCGSALAQTALPTGPVDAPNAPAYAAARPLVTPQSSRGLQFIGTQDFTYDTNPLLIISGAKPLAGSTTQPELLFNDTTPTSKVSADTRVDANVYDRSAFNSTDGHETLDFSDQDDAWGGEFKGNADYDTVRSSEITTFGENVPRIRHTGFAATPEISYNASEVDKLTLTGSATTSRYDNRAFVNYNLYTVTPAYEHNFDPLNAAILNVEAQRYQTTDDFSQTTDTIGPSLGWLATLTPRLTLKATGGFQETSQSGVSSNERSSGLNYIFSGDLAFNGLQDTTSLIVSRQQAPFANGTEALVTSLSGSESHALNARFAVTLDASYEEANYPDNIGVNLSSQASAGGGVIFHALQDLDVKANYEYKNEKLTDISGTISDNSVIVSLVYRPVAASF